MLTGKIYKNKISTEEESHATQLRQLNRIKSQPGFQYLEHTRPENNESPLVGTLKSQRVMFTNQIKSNAYMGTFPKSFLEEASANFDLAPASLDHILEYERKMKDHIQKVESRLEAKIAALETTLQSKNQIICELKTALKEKQKYISKLEQESNYSLTSRPNTERPF